MVFTKMLLQNTLAIRPYNYKAASEPLLPKVSRCFFSFFFLVKNKIRTYNLQEQFTNYLQIHF